MDVRPLLDLNIWIDIAIRPGLFPESFKAYKGLTAQSRVGLPLCGYTTLYYILSKALKPAKAKEFLNGLHNEPVNFVPFAKEDIILAHELAVTDYEDACVVASAIRSGYNLILTRNPKHFKNIPITVATPSSLLK